MTEQPDEVGKAYMSTILGQRSPYEISDTGSSACNEGSFSSHDDGIHLQLLRADSLWNLGKTDEAAALVSKMKQRDDWNENKNGYFARGLEALCDGYLDVAYAAFSEASRESDGLEAVFHSERAVNVAFWMACTGKMVEASQVLQDMTETTPFSGGIVAFAIHMSGDSRRAKDIAVKAIEKGFNDPWTIHAVAHSLYSLGSSEQCAEWLEKHRSHVQECSPFMKGHMEFHLGLCQCDMQDTRGLLDLINGPLWSKMPKSDQEDYWNASGLLNLLWKAEIRGLDVGQQNAGKQCNEALAIIDSSGVDPTKSAVFSLCILRWSMGDFRKRWEREIMQNENTVLTAVAKAICTIYPGGRESDFTPSALEEAETLMAPVANDLAKLGASPEQREVIEDFVGVVAKRAGKGEIDLREWDKRNRRPNVPFYDQFRCD